MDNSQIEENYDMHSAIERNKYVLNLVNMYIDKADNKIAPVFAIFSVISAAIFFITKEYLPELQLINNSSCFICGLKLLIILAGLFFFISIICYLWCIIPRFTTTKTKNRRFSIFYHEIKDYSTPDDYMKECSHMTDYDFNEEIMREIYYNSCICSKKMKFYRLGLLFSFGSLLCGCIAMLLYSFVI